MLKTLPMTMQAVTINGFGGPETMRLQDIRLPEVGADEVLIHIGSAGVGVWDPFEREGGFAAMFGTQPKFPYVLGSEGQALWKPWANRSASSSPMTGCMPLPWQIPKAGFMPNIVVVKADNVSHIPGNLTIEQAGVMPVDAITALRGLDDTLGLKPRELLMVFGASGGVGHLAVQLAKRLGARVLAVASGDDGVADLLGVWTRMPSWTDIKTTSKPPRQVRTRRPGCRADDQRRRSRRPRQAVRDARVAYPNGVEPEPQRTRRASHRLRRHAGFPRPSRNSTV